MNFFENELYNTLKSVTSVNHINIIYSLFSFNRCKIGYLPNSESIVGRSGYASVIKDISNIYENNEYNSTNLDNVHRYYLL